MQFLDFGLSFGGLTGPSHFLHCNLVDLNPGPSGRKASALTTKPLRNFSEGRFNWEVNTNHSIQPTYASRMKIEQIAAHTGKGSNCQNSMDPPNPTVDMHVPYDNDHCAF